MWPFFCSAAFAQVGATAALHTVIFVVNILPARSPSPAVEAATIAFSASVLVRIELGYPHLNPVLTSLGRSVRRFATAKDHTLFAIDHYLTSVMSTPTLQLVTPSRRPSNVAHRVKLKSICATITIASAVSTNCYLKKEKNIREGNSHS